MRPLCRGTSAAALKRLGDRLGAASFGLGGLDIRFGQAVATRCWVTAEATWDRHALNGDCHSWLSVRPLRRGTSAAALKRLGDCLGAASFGLGNARNGPRTAAIGMGAAMKLVWADGSRTLGGLGAGRPARPSRRCQFGCGFLGRSGSPWGVVQRVSGIAGFRVSPLKRYA